MEEREKVVCLAKLAEQAERYDDMVEFMKKLARMDVDMSAEERHLFSVGFKNAISAQRASWRILSSLEQQVTAGDQTGVMIDAYKKKVEGELRMVCNEILSIIAIHCLPLASSDENAVFFYKMKGDYYRYLAEVSTGTEKKTAAEQSLMAYQVQDLPNVVHNFKWTFWCSDLSFQFCRTNKYCCSMPRLLPPVSFRLRTRSDLALPSISRSSFMR